MGKRIRCFLLSLFILAGMLTGCAVNTPQAEPLENTIENLFHHASDVTFTEKERWLPSRFSAEEIASLGSVNPKFANNGRCAAGISLKFYTASPEISFTYNAEVLYTQIGGFDIYENGELSETEVLRSVGGRGKITYAKKSEGEALIEIYLPNNAEMTLWDFSLGDNWRVVPKEETLVLYYGDSITQSAYIETSSLNFAATASGIAGVDYINRGVGALFYDARALPETDTLKPDQIFIEFGANDLVRHHADGSVVVTNGVVEYCTEADVPQLIDNASAYLEKLSKRYPEAEIKVISVPWSAETLSEARRAALETYNTQLQLLAERLSMGFIDGAALNPHDSSYYCKDGIHFNAQGGLAFGESLAAYIES